MSVVSYELEQENVDTDPQGAESGIGRMPPKWPVFYRQASIMISSALERLFNDKIHMSADCRYKLAVESMVSLVHMLLLEVSITTSY